MRDNKVLLLVQKPGDGSGTNAAYAVLGDKSAINNIYPRIADGLVCRIDF
ncbi:hypothetical protein [Nocardia sp. NPDC050175]